MARGPDRVTRAWEGKKVVCIAGGPSVTKEMLDVVEAARLRDEVRVIVINDMYLVAPWADLCYFADAKWFKWQGQHNKAWPWVRFTHDEVKKAWREFKGERVTIKHIDNVSGPDIHVLVNLGAEGLSPRNDGVMTGHNSGFQVMNIAAHSGGNPIYLLGYDMQFDRGRSHSHTGHPNKSVEGSYHDFAQKFSTLQRPFEERKISVVNCAPSSRIACWPKGDIASLLAAA